MAEKPDRRGEGRSGGPSRRFGGSKPGGARPAGRRPGGARPDEPGPDTPAAPSPRRRQPQSGGSRTSGAASSGGRGAGRPKDSRPAGPRRSAPGAGRDRVRPPQRPPVDAGPTIDPDVTGQELPRSVREELRTMSRDAAETVSRHLVMSARHLDEDPQLAWEHAKVAVGRGGRLAVVREAAAVAAYRAGDYAAALAQFRAARRISGSDAYWPIMADCERGLGRPERALTMAGAPEAARLDRDGQVEMRIVAAGARRDLGQLDAAVVTLQCRELAAPDRTSWSARLKFAYADALAAAGRQAEAREWFERAAAADREEETEAAERVAELDGVVWIDLEADTEVAGTPDPHPGAARDGIG